MPADYMELFGDNPTAVKIARDQGPFWEYGLSAELLRQSLKVPARKWRDLMDGLYTNRFNRLTAAEALPWFQTKIAEASGFIGPLNELYTKRLPRSWGEPGEPGDVEEIAHVCSLIGKMGAEMVRWEEDVAFTRLPEHFEGLRRGLSGAAGQQLDELMKVPDVLLYAIDQGESAKEGEPTVVKHTIVFDLPEGWTENLNREFGKLNELIESGEVSLD